MDTLTPEERSERMSRVRGAHTKPEMVVRRMIHALGYRYRLHGRALPGRPDMVFAGRRKVIFVHGCFWHRHPDPSCALARLPKSRVDFWRAKLEGNRGRDERNEARLRELGWDVLVVWECQLRDRGALETRIRGFLG
jgi:DNA mismatch endonuclease (patch repair protein)